MNMDELFVNMRNTLPRLWWNIYQGCLEAGFDETRAFALLQTYILA